MNENREVLIGKREGQRNEQRNRERERESQRETDRVRYRDRERWGGTEREKIQIDTHIERQRSDGKRKKR